MDNKQTIDPVRAREMFLAAARPMIDRIGPSIEGTPEDVMVIVTAAMMAAFCDSIAKAHETAGLTGQESEATIHVLTSWGLELSREIDVRVVGTARRTFDGKLRVVRSDESATATFDLGDDA